MSTKHLRNISISQFESFLELACCKYTKTKGGHAKYLRSDLNRPIIFQTHIDPIPEFIVKNNLRLLGVSRKQFWEILESKAKVVKEGDAYRIIAVKPKDE